MRNFLIAHLMKIFHDVFQSYVRKHFSENNFTAESESEDEVWNNASLEDLDLDLQT